MKNLRVCVIDLVSKALTTRLWGRFMNANLTSIMPRVVALWCEQEGHDADFICYTGHSFDKLIAEAPERVDVAIIGAYTQAGLVSYALSEVLRARGAATVLGGPHARCYPQLRWLPVGAMEHDPHAYLKSQAALVE